MGVILDLCEGLGRLGKSQILQLIEYTFGCIFARKFGQKPVVGGGQQLQNQSILYTMW